MSLSPRSRLLVGLVLAALVIVIGAAIFWTQLLDPGDKGDTSTVLVTPTLAAETARFFDVSPAESRIDFIAEVGGVALEGVFPVESGTITFEPVGDDLRILVELRIQVDNVDTGNPAVDRVLRAAMATGDYPLAFYVATSRDLVPVTEAVITFMLDGELEVHNEAAPHTMVVEAQEVGGAMWAIATSDLDLAAHGVEFPALIGNTTIQLTARLQTYEVEGVEQAPLD
ncbi:MAG: YceI family protein [Anaerolineae bacterium]|nr:YceI family protein [Anaerolineae bacterium]